MLTVMVCGGRSQLDWCYEPAPKYDLGVLRHPRLSLPVGKHA